jgi:hypothetical protein
MSILPEAFMQQALGTCPGKSCVDHWGLCSIPVLTDLNMLKMEWERFWERATWGTLGGH